MISDIKNTYILPEEVKSKIESLKNKRQNFIKQSAELVEQASKLWGEMSNELIQALSKEEGYKVGDVVYNPDLDVKAIITMDGEWFVIPQILDSGWNNEENH